MEASGTQRTYGGATAEARASDRRGRLIAAATELIGTAPEDGGGLTVRGVCARAGLTPRYFYESFASADELTAAVVEETIAGAAAAVSAALETAEGTPEARSRATIEAFVAYAIDDPRRARILFVEAATSGALREQRALALRTFAALAAAQGRELFSDAEEHAVLLENTSIVVAGGIGELLLAWTRGELRSSREELIEDAVDLVAVIGVAASRLAAARGGGRE